MEKTNDIYESFEGYKLKILWRVVLIVAILGLLILFNWGLAESVREIFSDDDLILALKIVERDYYNNDYIQVQGTLYQYAAQDEVFDKYWEISHAYESYYYYMIWQNTYTQLDYVALGYSEEEIIGYMDTYKKELLDARESSEDVENQNRIQEFLELIEQ